MSVEHKPTGVVHVGIKGGNTACGFDTKKNPKHWKGTTAKVTCKKKGCK